MWTKKFTSPILIWMVCFLAPSRSLAGTPGDLVYRLSLLHEVRARKLNVTPLNVNNRLVPQERYGGIGTLDLYLHWLGFTSDVRVAGRYNDRDQARLNCLIREIYFARLLAGPLHFTVGRKILKWGTGYAFNPTGVIEPGRNAADPSDRLNRNQGRQVVALDAYFDSYSITILYANEFTFADGLRWGRDEVAARLYALISDLDLSLIAHWRETERLRLGINGASTIGAHLELHAEFLGQLGTDRLYHRALEESEPGLYFGEAAYHAREENSHRLFYRALLGAQYTFNSGVNLLLEYYTKSDGLTRDEWSRWREFTLAHQSRIIRTPADPRSYPEFFNALLTLDEDGAMRHYGFTRLYIPFQTSGLELILLGNLADRSGLIIPTYHCRFNDNVSGWLRLSWFGGPAASEFSMLFTELSVNAGLKLAL